VPASLLDANVWVAAVFPTHPFHRKAQQALRGATSADPAVFCRSTQQSFLRLISTPALLKIYGAEGLSNRDAVVALNALLTLPQIVERTESAEVVDLWLHLAARDTASPKVWMDAYLAAFAIKGGLRLVTLDGDFKKFETHGLDLLLLKP
jgi:uncharacterized protein